MVNGLQYLHSADAALGANLPPNQFHAVKTRSNMNLWTAVRQGDCTGAGVLISFISAGAGTCKQVSADSAAESFRALPVIQGKSNARRHIKVAPAATGGEVRAPLWLYRPGVSESGGSSMNVKQAVVNGDREGLELVSPAELPFKMSLRHHCQGNYKAGPCFNSFSL